MKAQTTHATNPSDLTKQQYHEVKHFLETFLQSNAHWHSKLIHYKFYRWGNKPRSLLAKLTLPHAKFSQILAFRDNASQVLHATPSEIIEILLTYFANLYRASRTDLTAIDTFLSSLSLPCLTPEQQEFLDTPLTEQEVKQVTSASSSSKTPGPNGYPAEYYKLLPDVVAFLNNLLN